MLILFLMRWKDVNITWSMNVAATMDKPYEQATSMDTVVAGDSGVAVPGAVEHMGKESPGQAHRVDGSDRQVE